MSSALRHFGHADDDDDEEDVLSSPSDSEDEDDKHGGQNGATGGGGATRRRGTGILFGNVDRKIKLVENDETVRYIDEEEGAREGIETVGRKIDDHTEIGVVVRDARSDGPDGHARATHDANGRAVPTRQTAAKKRADAINFEGQTEMLVDDHESAANDDELPSDSRVVMPASAYEGTITSISLRPGVGGVGMVPRGDDEDEENYDDDDDDDDNADGGRRDNDRKKDKRTRRDEKLDAVYTFKDGRKIYAFTKLFFSSADDSHVEEGTVSAPDSRATRPVLASEEARNEDTLMKTSLSETGIFTWPYGFLEQLPLSYDNDKSTVVANGQSGGFIIRNDDGGAFRDEANAQHGEKEERRARARDDDDDERKLSNVYLDNGDVDDDDDDDDDNDDDDNDDAPRRWLAANDDVCCNLHAWEDRVDWEGDGRSAPARSSLPEAVRGTQSMSVDDVASAFAAVLATTTGRSVAATTHTGDRAGRSHRAWGTMSTTAARLREDKAQLSSSSMAPAHLQTTIPAHVYSRTAQHTLAIGKMSDAMIERVQEGQNQVEETRAPAHATTISAISSLPPPEDTPMKGTSPSWDSQEENVPKQRADAEGNANDNNDSDGDHDAVVPKATTVAPSAAEIFEHCRLPTLSGTNAELEEGTWLNAIQWKDAGGRTQQKKTWRSSPLILDMNDPKMVFECDVHARRPGRLDHGDNALISQQRTLFGALKRNAAAGVLLSVDAQFRKQTSLSSNTGRARWLSDERRAENAWDFDTLLKLGLAAKKADPVIDVAEKQEKEKEKAAAEESKEEPMMRTPIFTSHTLAAVVLNTTLDFLFKHLRVNVGDADAERGICVVKWHRPCIYEGSGDSYEPMKLPKPIRIPHTQVQADKRVTLTLGKNKGKGVVRLRLRTLSRFSPLAKSSREECTFFVPRADSLLSLLKRWMESHFPASLRDITADEIRGGYVKFKMVRLISVQKPEEGAHVVAEATSTDRNVLMRLGECNENHVVCVDRPLVELLRTKELLSKRPKVPTPADDIMSANEELRASSGGKVYLCEYLEENPLYLAIPGMRLQLCTYYRKRTKEDNGQPLATPASASTKEGEEKNEGDAADTNTCFQPSVSTVRADEILGRKLILEPDMKSPFAPLTDIENGQYIGAVRCEMFAAPAVKHPVRDTDFLLMRSASGKWRLREFQGTVTIGQQFPRKLPLYVPKSKEINDYQERRLRQYVFRRIAKQRKDEEAALGMVEGLEAKFKEAETAKKRNRARGDAESEVRFDKAYLECETAEEALKRAKDAIKKRDTIEGNLAHFAAIFPDQKPELLRKRLRNAGLVFREKKTNTFDARGNRIVEPEAWVVGDGFVLPSENDIRRLVSCEEVCAYEAERTYRDMLQRNGVNCLFKPIESPQEEFVMSLIKPSLLPAALEMRTLVESAPWNVTQNFFDACMGKVQLAVQHPRSDPSGRGICFSLMRFSSTSDMIQRRLSKRAMEPMDSSEFKRKCGEVWTKMLKAVSGPTPEELAAEAAAAKDKMNASDGGGDDSGSDDDDFLDDMMDEDDEPPTPITKQQQVGDGNVNEGDKPNEGGGGDRAGGGGDDDFDSDSDREAEEEAPPAPSKMVRRLRCVVRTELEDGTVKEEVHYSFNKMIIERMLRLQREWEVNRGKKKIMSEEEDEVEGQQQHRQHRKYLEQQRRERKRKREREQAAAEQKAAGGESGDHPSVPAASSGKKPAATTGKKAAATGKKNPRASRTKTHAKSSDGPKLPKVRIKSSSKLVPEVEEKAEPETKPPPTTTTKLKIKRMPPKAAS